MLINIHFVLVPLFLFLAAFFAASEASLFSLSRAQLETFRETRPTTYALMRRILFRPDAILSTVIIGNECVNIALGTSVTVLIEEMVGFLPSEAKIVLGVLVSSAMILFASEIMPKVLAFRMPALIGPVLVYPMSWFHFLVTPLRKVFLGLSQWIIKLFGIPIAPPSGINEKDFLTLVEVGEETGSLDRDEKQMIFNVFHFSDLSVASVMTPWNKVFHVNDDITPSEILEMVKTHTYSRIPIFSKRQNRVMGVLYAKELLKLLADQSEEGRREIVRQATFPPYIVSTHKQVSKLFREFKVKKVHIALVVDEFGRHLGIITLEDLLNAIFRTDKRAAGENR